MLTKTHFNSILMVLVVPISPTNNLILTSTNHKMTQFKCRSIPLRLIMVNLFSQVNRRNIIMILCSSMIVETPFLQACRSFNSNPKTVLMQSMMVIFSTRNHSISASKTWRERALRSRRVSLPSQASWSRFYNLNLMVPIKKLYSDGKSLDLLTSKKSLVILQTTPERPCRQQVQ